VTSIWNRFRRRQRGRFTILSIDGGGIRGLIPARVLARLEQLLREHDPEATLAGSFDLIVGTSTGGLITLGLTMPSRDGRPVMEATDIAELFSGPEARRIFTRPRVLELPVVATLSGLLDPKYRPTSLRRVLASRFGDAVLGDALTRTMVSTYDMYARKPRFFKSWRPDAIEVTAIDAGVATAAAPTYFPPFDDGAQGALVDGGVFLNNPTLAGIVEAVKHAEAGPLRAHDTFVVSLGTGRWEPGFRQEHVSRWGELGWILPKKGEPPVVGAMLDGQSDAVHHWTHFLLNHLPGEGAAGGLKTGRGPHYFRFQVDIPGRLPLDGVEPHQIDQLEGCARMLIDERDAELGAIAEALVRA